MDIRIDYRVKVKIRLAQPVEFLEIPVVKYGAHHAGKLPKACLLGVVEAAVGGEPANDIRLPQWNETISRLGRGRFAMCFSHTTIAHATTTIASSLSRQPEASR